MRLQSAVRRFLCMRLLARAINSAIKCQAIWRGHIKQLAFFKVQRAVIRTQAWCRRLLARLWCWRERERRRMAAEEVVCRAVWERERQRRLEIEREEQRIRRLIQLAEASEVNFALHVYFKSMFLLRCFNKHCDRLFIYPQNSLKYEMDAQRKFEMDWQNELGHQGFLRCLCRRTHVSTNLNQNGVRESARAPNWVLIPPRGTATRGLIPRGCHWLKLFARVYGDTLQLFEACHPVATRRAANQHSYLKPPRPIATVLLTHTRIYHASKQNSSDPIRAQM